MKHTRRLREILAGEKTILVPGAYDALSAKILKQAGFRILYMSGSGLTASLTGLPDLGILTMREMVDQARNIVIATDLPLICDADTGYGNPVNVIRTVREYERAGVAGIHLEDQVTPKRCGHFQGKQIVPAVEMVKKIEAANYAREDGDFLLIARTDARSVAGLDEALRRARLYVDKGADMIFVESPESVGELERICDELADVPLLVNMVEGGKTPLVPFEALEEMGFKIVLYPTSSIRAAAKALQALAEHLSTCRDTQDFEHHLVSFEGRNRITGLSEIRELERRFVHDEP
jgi:carboxyvinyl-carboxyphosphonate phosphorylmutase